MEEKGCSSVEYSVQRQVLDELCLDQVAKKGKWSAKPTFREQLKSFFRCSVPHAKEILLRWIPVLGWLPKYSIKKYALGDLISGCSVSIMHLPQGMAYALLASLRPVFGLYTSLFPVLVYLIFGTSKHISIGTFAVISIMIGSVTERLAPDSNFLVNGTNGTVSVNLDERDAYRVQIACSLTVLAGLFQILLGMVRFGFVVTYLSEPLVRGYTTASACHVLGSQLKYLFGVNPARFSGPLSLIYTLVEICRLIPQTVIPELVVSLVSLTVLIVVKEFNGRFRHRLLLPIPIELIVIIAATIISHFGQLPDKYNINVVGEIPSGLQAPRAPDATLFSAVIGDAFAVAIVGYAIAISLGKTFALKHGYQVDSNQELVALGLSNTIGSCFQCYTVTCSMSRSLVQESTGGKTQIAGLISSVIVLITVLKIGSLFEDLPKAVLSTIVFVNLKGMFKQFMDVPMLWKTNKVDLLVWLVTFASTILLNLDLGLAVSIAFSLLTVIFRTQLPRYSILGQVPGTNLYLDVDSYKEAKEIPGIKIFRTSATIYYTNAEMYLEALQEKSGIQIAKLLAVKKKEAEAVKKQNKKAKNEQTNQRARNYLNGIFSFGKKKKSAEVKGQNSKFAGAENLTECPVNILFKGQVNKAYESDYSDMASKQSDSITLASQDSDDKICPTDVSCPHSLILDLSTTSFLDTVAVKTLKNIFRDLGEIGIGVYLSDCQACVVEELERAGFFSESIPKSRLFVTIHDAVLHILDKLGQTDNFHDVFYITEM
ncbi:solute carrier family 26 member 6-like isoform X2 [Corythoichthys intestinalis]|uniref:solute carrier family 26 member 6-like isoform X2 n=1 Tax=Corythoichthys intestinalis TaxID=161448 RepID=UPI0025A63442|nr:solute carrier family 26 member 6-like isoform X2 [Corythoichthys intestinalis]XP_061802877.1 solute carrier family 26 member 6-like [Nerophis lumbriciformis]